MLKSMAAPLFLRAKDAISQTSGLLSKAAEGSPTRAKGPLPSMLVMAGRKPEVQVPPPELKGQDDGRAEGNDSVTLSPACSRRCWPNTPRAST